MPVGGLESVLFFSGHVNQIVRKLKGGYTNETFLAKSGNKKVVIRKYKSSRTLVDIRFELHFLKELKKQDFPVPLPLSEIIAVGKSRYVIFEYLSGRVAGNKSVNRIMIKSLIRTIAKIHNISGKISPKGKKKRRDLFIFDFDKYVAGRFYIFLPTGLRELFYFELKYLQKKLFKARNHFKNIPIHNDLALVNLKFMKNKLTAILDFDDCCLAPRVSDLATLLTDICFFENNFDRVKMRNCLYLYEKYSKLSSKEIRVLLLLIRHRLLLSANFFLWKYMESKEPSLMKRIVRLSKLIANCREAKVSYGGIKLAI